MGHRSADGIDGHIGDEEVGVRAVGPKRIVGWKLQLLALLPPAVLRGDHAPGNAGVVFYWDIVLPLVLLGLLIAHERLSAQKR